MTEFRVIYGIKKEKPNYRKLYSNALHNTLQRALKGAEEIKVFQFDNLSLDIRKKIVFYYVKEINATNLDIYDYELLVAEFKMISMINTIIGTLTPREFQTIFPIAKDYDGEKYGMKDYFYTKQFIEEFGMDRVIGEEATRLHWNYCNWELTKFASQVMCIMSAIRRAEGGKGIMEEFLEEQGVTTYTETTDSKGNKILRNNDTGELVRVRKPRPRHLKIVK